ncbi:MAG: hypothetical protein ACYC6X_01375 [Minisyncoccota bacterium]
MNTPHKGHVRYIVFKDGAVWYAAGLEFNIVESADDPRIALMNLFDAMQGYVESSKKVKGARISPLNQKTDKEYENLWSIVTAPKKIKSPYRISTFGVTRI